MGLPVSDDQHSHQAAREAMALIGQQARRSNAVRADQLQQAVDALARGGLTAAARADAAAVAHQLVGSAGTFGFPHASDLAGELERFFAADGDVPTGLADAQRLVSELHRALAGEPDEPVEDA